MRLKTQKLFNSRYQLHEPLGAGNMGSVYRATDRLTGQGVALKRVVAGLGFVDLLRLSLANEFQTLASLRHPHIVLAYIHVSIPALKGLYN